MPAKRSYSKSKDGETSEQEAERIANVMITRRIAARLFGYTPMTITNIENQGLLEFNAEGRMTLGKLCESMTSYMKGRKTSDRMVDDEKLRTLKIEEMELKIKRTKGELISVEGVKTWLMEMLGVQHAMLAAIPIRFSRDIRERQRLLRLYEEVQNSTIVRIKELSGDDAPISGDDSEEVNTKKRKTATRKSRKKETA